MSLMHGRPYAPSNCHTLSISEKIQFHFHALLAIGEGSYLSKEPWKR